MNIEDIFKQWAVHDTRSNKVFAVSGRGEAKRCADMMNEFDAADHPEGPRPAEVILWPFERALHIKELKEHSGLYQIFHPIFAMCGPEMHPAHPLASTEPKRYHHNKLTARQHPAPKTRDR